MSPPPAASASRIAFGTVLAVLALTCTACNDKSAAGGGQPGKSAGEVAYGRRCETCHNSKGQGSSSWPPLAGSPWLVADHETPIRIVLLGLQGEITVNGQKYFNTMPNQGVTMSDREIADVLTYTRSAWGNTADPILEAEVAAVRASLAGRTTPWTARELDALRPK